MRYIIACALMFCVASPAWAGDRNGGFDGGKMQSKFRDFEPGDGFMEPGSPSNPFILTTPHGDRFRVQSRSTDFEPGDGFMEQGSPSNPWIIKQEK